MAALFWNSSRRTLTSGTGSIVGLRIVIENTLRQDGFADVVRNNLEVAGGKNGVWVSIAHFQIQGRDFWEVVMGSGDDVNTTRDTVSAVANRLQRLVFFD
jgi:hypothetical protein